MSNVIFGRARGNEGRTDNRQQATYFANRPKIIDIDIDEQTITENKQTNTDNKQTNAQKQTFAKGGNRNYEKEPQLQTSVVDVDLFVRNDGRLHCHDHQIIKIMMLVVMVQCVFLYYTFVDHHHHNHHHHSHHHHRHHYLHYCPGMPMTFVLPPKLGRASPNYGNMRQRIQEMVFPDNDDDDGHQEHDDHDGYGDYSDHTG